LIHEVLIEQLFSSVDKYCHLDSNLYTTVEYIPAMDTSRDIKQQTTEILHATY